jgi:hypothetical protein
MNDGDQANESGVWYVQFSADVVRAMSLEQLDAAFQSGAISEDTYVRQDGTTEWSRLASIAGIEPSEPERTPSPASYAVESSDLGSGLGPQSIRPVVSELHDLDVDEPVELRPRRRGAVLLTIAAMMLLGGIGFAATKYSGASSASSGPVAASQPAAATPVLALPSNLTAAISEAHLGEQTLPQESKLTDAQKKAVLEADKKREKQLDEKRARTPHPKKRAPSGPVFHTGGNVHDPLNSSIGSPAK